jgi:hypothetical protein
MAKVYQLSLATDTQSNFDKYCHSLMFADSINPVHVQTEGGTNIKALVVTSNVESESHDSSRYELLGDDSVSEVSIDIATGKFVQGNVIAGIAPLSEIQSDVRNYTAYEITGSDHKLFIGVCDTTQSQDYTPDLVANSRVLKMMTPDQVKTLNL